VSAGFDWLAQAADGPWNGLGVGIFFRTHSFGNQKFGPGRVQTIRFIAEKTGQVHGVAPYIELFPQPGYSTGDGGRIAIYLYEAANNGQLGNRIGTGEIIERPAAGATAGQKCCGIQGREFKLVGSLPTVTKGKQYHWVFEQIGTSGESSMGGISDQSSDPTRTPPGGLIPVFGDESMVSMFGNGTLTGALKLQVHGSKFPVFATVYTDGTWIGNMAHQGVRDDVKQVDGANRVRAVMKPTTDRTVRYVYAAPWKQNDQSNVDVKVEVKDSSGALLATTVLPASSIGLDVPPAGGIDADEPNCAYGTSDEKAPWVKASLGKTLTLKGGMTYYVEFSASAGADVWFMPMMEHEDYAGRSERFTEVRGQFSTNGGASWQTATHRGSSNPRSMYSILLHYY
jgi:hypothetical protein